MDIPLNFSIERFLKFIKKSSSSDCMEWIGFTHDGYGKFNIKTDTGWRQFMSHRVSFAINKRPPSIHLVIDHICRNRKCVNPDHLREVTATENVIRNSRSFAAYNLLKTHCPQGHEYSFSNTGIGNINQRYCITCKRIKKREYNKRKTCT